MRKKEGIQLTIKKMEGVLKTIRPQSHHYDHCHQRIGQLFLGRVKIHTTKITDPNQSTVQNRLKFVRHTAIKILFSLIFTTNVNKCHIQNLHRKQLLTRKSSYENEQGNGVYGRMSVCRVCGWSQRCIFPSQPQLMILEVSCGNHRQLIHKPRLRNAFSDAQ